MFYFFFLFFFSSRRRHTRWPRDWSSDVCSSDLKPWEGYSYNRLSDDIRRIITILKLDSFTLIGHSVGGAIATRYMARNNGYGVSKLALVAAAVPSFIIHPDFPYGLPKDDVNKIIEMTYHNRLQMLHDFTKQFFFHQITQSIYDCFFIFGIVAACYSNLYITYLLCINH